MGPRDIRVRVEGSPTLVRTDRGSLLCLPKNAGKPTRIGRWVLGLRGFAFDLQHKAQRWNALADRPSDYPTRETPAEAEPRGAMCDSGGVGRHDGSRATVELAERCRECWGQLSPQAMGRLRFGEEA